VLLLCCVVVLRFIGFTELLGFVGLLELLGLIGFVELKGVNQIKDLILQTKFLIQLLT